MKTLLIFLTLTSFALCSKTFLISDHDYTNQNFTRVQTIYFINSFKKNRMSLSDKVAIYRNAKFYRINVLAILARMQCETDIVELDRTDTIKSYPWRYNMAMSYGILPKYRKRIDGSTYYLYYGYQVQLRMGVRLMRKAFDQFDHERDIKLYCIDEVISPINAATYANYIYNPYYGVHKKFKGKKLAGNVIFRYKFLDYKERWREINGSMDQVIIKKSEKDTEAEG